jgi:hypothetical protein
VGARSGTEFWDEAAPLLASGDAEEGTVMGHPCIRVGGQFLAMPFHDGPGMVVKLPARRVAEVIAEGRGCPFSPNGRIFREWLHVPRYDAEVWRALLAEGRDYVSR